MNETDAVSKTGPWWMLRVTIGGIVLSVVISLFMDMNGNLVLSEFASVPDILNPAPMLVVLLAIAVSVVIPVVHLIRYLGRRGLWVCMLLLSRILAAGTIAPAL
jgi:hypothetical protein